MWDFLVGPVVKMLPIQGDPTCSLVWPKKKKKRKRKKGRRMYI